MEALEYKSNYNVELLLALQSGDLEKLQPLWDRLERHAYSLALYWFPASVDAPLRDEAVDKAMDRVRDKIDYIKASNHPWEYAKEIIFNALGNFHRDCKLQGAEITAIRSLEERDTLCEIDEGIQELFIIPDENEREKIAWGSGYHEFEIISEGKKSKTDDDRYHSHIWIEKLKGLKFYEWWWDMTKWADKVQSTRKTTMQGLRGHWEEAASYYKECTKKLWSNHDWIMAFIDNISGDRARLVVKAYLSGLEQVEISNYLKKRFGRGLPPYVSRVIRKYLGEWEEHEIAKARMILLTHHLAILYRNFSRDTQREIYSKGLVPLIRRGDFAAHQELNNILEQHRIKLYNKVISTLETKAYLGDLGEEPVVTDDLMELCSWFYNRWYSPKSLYNSSTQNVFELALGRLTF